MHDLDKIFLIIPALNPDEKLTTLVSSLKDSGFKNIIIVNDGSDHSSLKYFETAKMNGATILTHGTNLGKGRALKTAFNYCLTLNKDITGVVTADADGQHLPSDIKKVAISLLKNPNSLILGSRTFNDKNVPFRSKFGNIMTRTIFQLISGIKLRDTQTGLRAIPTASLKALLKLSGEAYEYEMNMLIESKNLGNSLIEEDIETVYIENNRSSHFNPFWDSMKIYFLIIRFGMSSFLGASADFIVFSLVHTFTGVLGGMLAARTVSTIITFFLNKKVVFQNSESKFVFLKFVSLVIFFALIGSTAIEMIHAQWGINIILAKLIVELSLFLISFVIQRDFIFTNNAKAKA